MSKKPLGHKVGHISFVVDSALAMGKDGFCKAFEHRLGDPAKEFKIMEGLKKKADADAKKADSKKPKK